MLLSLCTCNTLISVPDWTYWSLKDWFNFKNRPDYTIKTSESLTENNLKTLFSMNYDKIWSDFTV